MTSFIICGACGKMGRVLADVIAKREDCFVAGGIDRTPIDTQEYPIVKDAMQLQKGDVIVDFSNPEMLSGLLSFALKREKPLVIATTGFTEKQIQEITEASKKIPLFFSFNMSLGVNLLAALSCKAAKVLGEDFDIEIIEKHHNQKVDAPSGTAYLLADSINREINGNYHYVYDRHARRGKREKREIGFHSIRGGTIVGEHDVLFAGPEETITLSHCAQSRTIFARGAVNAALFLKGKPPGLYSMDDLLKEES